MEKLIFSLALLVSKISKGEIPPPPPCEPEQILYQLMRLIEPEKVLVVSTEAEREAVIRALTSGEDPQEALAAQRADELLKRVKQ